MLTGTRQLVMSETLQTLSALGEFCSASSGRLSDSLCDGSEHPPELCPLIFLDVCTNLFAIPSGAGSTTIVPLTSQLGVVRACRPALSSAEPLRQILILCHSRRVLHRLLIIYVVSWCDFVPAGMHRQPSTPPAHHAVPPLTQFEFASLSQAIRRRLALRR